MMNTSMSSVLTETQTSTLVTDKRLRNTYMLFIPLVFSGLAAVISWSIN